MIMFDAGSAGSVRLPWARLPKAGARGCSSSRSSIVLAIFYFIILLPMKEAAEGAAFLESLKVGDRVVTTGGIYGQVTRLGEQTVQIQIADKVRIEVARRRSAATRAGAGQEPEGARTSDTRVEQTRTGMHMSRTFAGNSSPSSSSSSCSRRVGVYPIVAARYGIHSPSWLMDKQLKLGLDLKGGVHLVLRVKTDDALRIETELEMERLRAELLTNANITGRRASRADVDRSSGSRACRRRRTRRSGTAADGGRDELRPRRRHQRHLHVHDEAEHRSRTLRDEAVVQARADDRAPRQRAGRHRAEHRAAGPERRPDSGAAARRHRRRAREGDHPVDRPARAEDRRAGAVRRRRKRCSPNGQVPPGMEIVPGVSGVAGRPAAHGVLPGAQGGGRHRHATCATRGRRSTRTTSRRSASR